MNCDFYMNEVAEFDEEVKKIQEMNDQFGRETNPTRKKQLKSELANLRNTFRNTFWSAMNGRVTSDHVKYKIMHTLLSVCPAVKENLKDLYQAKLTSTERALPQMHNAIDVAHYPMYTLFLKFKFTLAKPYISKDDEVFYICENPIRKDKVFKVPVVSSGTWKGNMRFAARMVSKLSPDADDSSTIKKLFGNERAASSGFRQGRLWFYDTLFKRISLEVINPHDRKTKAGTVPIPIEAVPAGGEGYFSILYCPFDLIGSQDVHKVKEEIAADLYLLADALQAMMLEFGFSAKKTAGYGVIKPVISEVIVMMKGIKAKEHSVRSRSKPSKTKKTIKLDELKAAMEEVSSPVLFEDVITELKRLANELVKEVCNEA